MQLSIAGVSANKCITRGLRPLGRQLAARLAARLLSVSFYER